jgi:hypothetical protein
MTDIDRLLVYEDDSFGVIPLVVAKAAMVAARQGQSASAPGTPQVVVVPPPTAAPASMVLVGLSALGVGFGVGYMISRRG